MSPRKVHWTPGLRIARTLLLALLAAAPSALAHGLVAPSVGGLASGPDAAAGSASDGSGDGLAPAPAPRAPAGSVPSVSAASAAAQALAPTLAPFERASRVQAVAGTPWTRLPVPSAGAAPTQMEFACPSGDQGTTVNDGANTFTVRATCPYRIIDDADLLGSAQVAVSPKDPRQVAFFSLHGAGTDEGPTPRSRDPSPEGTAVVTGLSHTTFTSTDMGVAWYDNPWGQEGFGEHVAGVMDRDGNMYIAALWSKPIAGGHFDYLFKLYKADTVETKVSANYQYDEFVQNRAPGNTIEEVNLVYLPAPAPEVEGNATGGNATAPADPSEVGNATVEEPPVDSANDRVMAVWWEKALDWENSTTGKSSWIDAAWSDTRTRNNWSRLEDKELIGPCMAASNPVAYKGKAYVACVADRGYSARNRAHIGQIDVWSIDPMTGKTQLVEFTGLEGGRPRMASRPDGYMAVATVERHSESNVDTTVSFGWYGRYWTGGIDAGPILHGASGRPALEARITAMALVDEQSTLFLAYMERVNNTGVPEPNPQPPDPSDPTSGLGSATDTLSEYRKFVATFNECGGPLDLVDLNVGTSRHPFQEGVVNDATGVFDDLQDGMTVATMPDESQEVFFAYGDHGVIQYGWIHGSTGGDSDCAVFQPIENPPVPATPAALGASSPYGNLVGATVGATALAMVGYLLAAKRRTLSKLAVKDR